MGQCSNILKCKHTFDEKEQGLCSENMSSEVSFDERSLASFRRLFIVWPVADVGLKHRVFEFLRSRNRLGHVIE